MAEETTPHRETQQPPATPQMRARQRAPKSADAKLRGLAARKFHRQMDQLKASKDVRKLEEATAALARLNGAAEEEKDAPEQPREGKPEQPEQQAPPKELTAVPEHMDASKPGWPTKSALADAAPTVTELVNVAAVFLAGTKFDITKSIAVRVGDQVGERLKADVLAEKLTPLAAKYGMTLLDSPEAVAVAGLVTVFGQPLLEMALKKMQAPALAVPTGGA